MCASDSFVLGYEEDDSVSQTVRKIYLVTFNLFLLYWMPYSPSFHHAPVNLYAAAFCMIASQNILTNINILKLCIFWFLIICKVPLKFDSSILAIHSILVNRHQCLSPMHTLMLPVKVMNSMFHSISCENICLPLSQFRVLYRSLDKLANGAISGSAGLASEEQ